MRLFIYVPKTLTPKFVQRKASYSSCYPIKNNRFVFWIIMWFSFFFFNTIEERTIVITTYESDYNENTQTVECFGIHNKLWEWIILYVYVSIEIMFPLSGKAADHILRNMIPQTSRWTWPASVDEIVLLFVRVFFQFYISARGSSRWFE